MPANKKRSAKKQSTRTPKIHLQYGALPYRKSKTAGVEVLLVTSRETKRWIIPKGWPIKGLSPKKSAAREAYEEAGVLGAIRNKPIGRYVYNKMLNERTVAIPCQVRVFPLRVRRQGKTWPERQQRDARWFPAAAAAKAVMETGLQALIAGFTNGRQK
ncbi:MAG: NUDIX hydrolase [Steroidobacteraceae bacterium]